MHTKILPGGNLDAYFPSKKNHRGELREQHPIKLSGHLEVASEYLRKQAPPHVTQADQKRRLVRHLWRHLIHIILCFSEAQAIVEQLLPRVINAKVDLILAGTFREALAFSWTEHPQNVGTHAHGSLDCRFLPVGGPCHLNLSAKDNLLHDRVLSHKLGLPDPLSQFPLLLATDASWKKENIKWIRPLLDAVHALDAQKKTAGDGVGHRELLGLLREFHFEVLAVPDANGSHQLLDSSALDIPLYKGMILTRTPEQSLVYFKGPICRPGYDLAKRRKQEQERDQAIDELKNHTDKVFRPLLSRISARIDAQKSLGVKTHGGSERVMLAEFLWLDGPPEPLPEVLENQAPSCPTTFELDLEYGTENPMRYAPEFIYPFDTGWDEPIEPELLDSAFPPMGGKWIVRSLPQKTQPETPKIPELCQTTSLPQPATPAPILTQPNDLGELLARKRRQIKLQLAQLATGELEQELAQIEPQPEPSNPIDAISKVPSTGPEP
ncbi:MAG TPA: hypothetical protein VFE51_27770, partial [Verrucomicrobiae bacterium]|nr:hypothetical protein [Verrucomicrobiae bacterium]